MPSCSIILRWSSAVVQFFGADTGWPRAGSMEKSAAPASRKMAADDVLKVRIMRILRASRYKPITMLLLSRVEAHFHLGIHSDRVAALGRGLITELRPRHRLAELRAAVELRDLAFLVDDAFAASRSARGFPKGRDQHRGALDQESALFVRRNGDFRRVLLLGSGVLRLFRRIGGAGSGLDPGHQEYGPGGIAFPLGSQSRDGPLRHIKGKSGPGHPHDTVAA